MIKYTLKRLLYIIPVILGVAVLIFTIMYFVPGDPATLILSANASQADIEAKRHELGLDLPYIVRLFNFLKSTFLHFDFGKSMINGSDITRELLTRFPRTLILALTSMILSLLIGTPLGITAAIHPNKWQDSISMFVALVGCAMPSFWLGMLLVLAFSVNLGWLPSSGMGGIQYWILPCIANSMMGIAMQARQTRSAFLEVLSSDYITTARSKGVSHRGIIYGHALPNALIPIITSLGVSLAAQISGSLVIESLFSIPGIGLYIITAVNQRDYTVIQSGVVFLAIVFSLVMLLVDLVYAVVDPRIKAQFVE